MVWLGSAVVLLVSTVLGMWQLQGLDRVLLIVAGAIYVFGVHVPTITINIPLNNHHQSQDLETMTAAELLQIKAGFESCWLRFNAVRAVLAILTTVLLLILLARL